MAGITNEIEKNLLKELRMFNDICQTMFILKEDDIKLLNILNILKESKKKKIKIFVDLIEEMQG